MHLDSRRSHRSLRSPWMGLALLASLSISGSAQAISFANVVSLGDSLFHDSGGVRSPLAPEHIADKLGASFTRLAQGGATSTTLLSQGQHTTAAASFGAGDLAMLWIGGNDFLSNAVNIALGNFGFLNTLEANVETALSALQAAGMDIVLFNLPDMATVPGVVFAQANFSAASAEWRTRVETLATTYGAAYVDIFSLMNDVYADPAAYAIAGVEPLLKPNTCLDICVFADSIHPSAVAQGFITNEVIAAMNSFYDLDDPLVPLTQIELAALAGFVIPEPATALLVGGGLLGLVASSRRGRTTRAA